MGSSSNLKFFFLAVVATATSPSEAFQVTTPKSIQVRNNNQYDANISIEKITRTSSPYGTTTQLFVGNWISGVTGAAPSKPLLTPELESQLVAGTSLENKELECVYKATQDGWSAINFHQNVDEKGSALVVALTRSGKLFGGFNPLGWRSTDDYYNSNAAYLWFASGNSAIKCPILRGGNAAIFDYATGGPCFGAADLIIGEPKAAIMGGFAGPDMMDTSVNAGSLKEGKCTMGGTYRLPDGGKNWPVLGKFQLVQLEVYCNANVGSIGSGGGGSWWPF